MAIPRTGSDTWQLQELFDELSGGKEEFLEPNFTAKLKSETPEEMTLSDEQIQLAFKRLSGGKEPALLLKGFTQLGVFSPFLKKSRNKFHHFLRCKRCHQPAS